LILNGIIASMKQQRLESLADGIFAIVMTLLVLEIRIPELHNYSEIDLLQSIIKNTPLYLSYLLSFVVLFTYWRSHHFVTSIFAKNIDNTLTNINAIFLFLIAFVPYSSHLLGSYSESIVAIWIFSLHTIAIGIVLFWMRYYVDSSRTIENTEISPVENRHAYARILFPVFSAFIALVISPFNISLALSIFTLGLFLNYAKRSTKIIFKIIGYFYSGWKE